jgi:hypothetical protein
VVGYRADHLEETVARRADDHPRAPGIRPGFIGIRGPGGPGGPRPRG